MKKEWQKKRLGELADVQSGGTPLVSCKAYWSGDLPWYSSGELNGLYTSVPERTISKAGLESSNAKLFPAGSLLIGMYDTAALKMSILDRTGAFNQAIAGVKPNDQIDLVFVLHAINAIRENVLGQRRGVRQKNLSLGKIRDIELSLPPLPEQRRIVAVLDEAFDGIATAKANAEKNLQNTRDLFESHLRSLFTQSGQDDDGGHAQPMPPSDSARKTAKPISADANGEPVNNEEVTKTGGRKATTRHIPGELALSVGMPTTGAKRGWQWSRLEKLARLESGHTPSRRHPEYWEGDIPWIGIQDAREHHGQRIADTFQHTNALGIENSSARILPAGTVCLSRTASVGYVLIMGRAMATSQDFVNWVCSTALMPDFLMYLLLAEARAGLLRYASGSVHQTIYFPEAKAFHICHPDMKSQTQLVKQCDALRAESEHLASIYQRKLAALDELKKSLLHQAFSGAL